MNPLQEILTGPQAVKYGALPKVELPEDDSLLSRFALELLEIVKDKGIYRRGNLPMLADPERGRLELVSAQTFRTWVESHLVCFKRRFDRNGEPYDVLHTMSKETAEGVLKCMEFLNGLREMEMISPICMPVMDEETGEVRFLQPGYDEKTKILTFSGL